MLPIGTAPTETGSAARGEAGEAAGEAAAFGGLDKRMGRVAVDSEVGVETAAADRLNCTRELISSVVNGEAEETGLDGLVTRAGSGCLNRAVNRSPMAGNRK